MILQGNQRGGARNLALHLLKDENDHVAVHELRGFVSHDLESALKEADAHSRATRAKQFLYSLSLNPPPNEKVSTSLFEETIERVETELGLVGQPRAVVFHEKNGRRHAHAVWSRIDVGEGKAIQLSFTKRKLTGLTREIFLEQGWEMPAGLLRSNERDQRNFTLAQWQQAQRQDRDPKEIKADIQESWSISDGRAAMANALLERGYILAKGDRRGFVAVDFLGEVYSISNWSGQKAKSVRAAFGEPDGLPSVEEACKQWNDVHKSRLRELKVNHDEKVSERLKALKRRKLEITLAHRCARDEMANFHEKRQREESQKRQARFRKGLRGLFDRLTGAHTRLRKENEAHNQRCMLRHRAESDALIQEQLAEAAKLYARRKRLLSYSREQRRIHRQHAAELHSSFERNPSGQGQKQSRPGRTR